MLQNKKDEKNRQETYNFRGKAKQVQRAINTKQSKAKQGSRGVYQLFTLESKEKAGGATCSKELSSQIILEIEWVLKMFPHLERKNGRVLAKRNRGEIKQNSGYSEEMRFL